MTRRSGIVSLLLLAGAAVWPAGPATAQTGDTLRPRRTRSVEIERIMRLRDRLGLTEDQLAALRALRDERVDAQRGRLDEWLDLRARVRSGDAEPDELRAFARQRREATRALGETHRERLDAILTEDQRGQLQQMIRPGRGMRGRGAAGMGGRGYRGGRFRDDPRSRIGRRPGMRAGPRGMRGFAGPRRRFDPRGRGRWPGVPFER